MKIIAFCSFASFSPCSNSRLLSIVLPLLLEYDFIIKFIACFSSPHVIKALVISVLFILVYSFFNVSQFVSIVSKSKQ
uniref:Ovule protein n=1 Tax=Schistosoma curassoni TaxID=6186 RepID=A0A183JR50_9TREM